MTEEHRSSYLQTARDSGNGRTWKYGTWLLFRGTPAALVCVSMLVLLSACSRLTPAQKAQQQLEAARKGCESGKDRRGRY